jgi:hypothetical protein
MDKAEVIGRYQKLLEELDEPAERVILCGGSALVVLGIRETTSDLDVDIDPKLFKFYATKFPVKKEPNVNDLIEFAPDVDIHEFDPDTGIVFVNGVWSYSPSAMLIQKRHLARMPNRKPGKREQDLIDIQQLELLVKGQRLTARVLA